jgi:hypothetical protein
MVSCCSGGLEVRRAAAWYYVLGVKEDAYIFIDLFHDFWRNLPNFVLLDPSLEKLVYIDVHLISFKNSVLTRAKVNV